MFESVENNRKMILGAYRKLKSYYYYDKTKKVDMYVNSAYHTLYIVLSGEMQHDFCLRNGIFGLHSECISAKVNSTDVSANYRDDTGDLHVTHNCVSKYL